MKQIIRTNQIRYEDKMFEFNETQTLTFIKVDNGFRMICSPFYHEEITSSVSECINEFGESLNFLWIAYVLSDDSKLDKKAKTLRGDILRQIKCNKIR